IPKPLYFKNLSESFDVNDQTIIYVEPGKQDLKSVGDQISDQIRTITGLKLQVVQKNVNVQSNYINLTTKEAIDSLGIEGYRLNSDRNCITITAKTAHGIFYGMQS